MVAINRCDVFKHLELSVTLAADYTMFEIVEIDSLNKNESKLHLTSDLLVTVSDTMEVFCDVFPGVYCSFLPFLFVSWGFYLFRR